MNSEAINDGVCVPQAQLDRWRAYAEQTRIDVLSVRQLVAGGQKEGAGQLLTALLENTLIVGHSLDDAGANRPAGMKPRPTGADRQAAQAEAEE